MNPTAARNGKTPQRKWPFPAQPTAPRRSGSGMNTRAMLLDVCLVAAWGATIPGLLWLGAAGGF